ncbi:ferrous iron transport protein B [bacterium]|nr:ferrous iron transport protein B [bacterium]
MKGLTTVQGSQKVRPLALVGQPNTGKTTLFNALTGLSHHVGNWPGKTVDRAEGRVQLPKGEMSVVDLPGTYALTGGSVEEEIAWSYLLDERPSVVIVVAEATRLRRGLRLLLEVREITPNVLLAVTMMDEARRQGIPPNLEVLARELALPVVGVVAPKGEGLDELKSAIASRIATPANPQIAPYEAEVEVAVLELERVLDEEGVGRRSTRWLALRLLEGDKGTQSWIEEQGGKRAIVKGKQLALSLGDVQNRLVLAKIERARYWERMAGGTGRDLKTEKIDRLVLHPLLAFPIVLAVFAFIFWVTVTGAAPISGFLMSLFDSLAEGARTLLSDTSFWVRGPIVEGLIYGVGAVIAVMLPTMAIFFVLFAVLEDSGLIPRIAFTMDKVMKSVGGQGKQCLTCMMAYGCNIPGIYSARIMRGRDRTVAILTNAINPCNGRLGGMVFLSALFFGRHAWMMMAALVAISWLMVFLATWFLNGVLKGEGKVPFLIELPPYRKPDWGRVIGRALKTKVWGVLWRAAAVAAPFCLVFWFMSNLPAGVPFTETYTGRLVGALDPYGVPFGLDGAMLSSLIYTIPAKELMAASLAMTYGQATDLAAGFSLEAGGLGAFLKAHWSDLSAFCYLLFYMLYLPCGYTTVVIHKETKSWGLTLLSQALPLSLAIGAAFLAYRIGSAFGF